jgi:hypothetical protein
MKVLSIKQAYFRLPDDFEGGLSAALRLLADYHDEMVKKPDDPDEPRLVEIDNELENKSFKEVDCMLFDKFIDKIQDGKRLVGLVQLTDFDPKVPIETV